MKILLTDISGKVPLYDTTLYSSLFSTKNDIDQIYLLMPYQSSNSEDDKTVRLFNFSFLQRCKNPFLVKGFKAIQCLLNYGKLAYFLRYIKPDIAHLQWLPFLESCSLERFLLKLFKKISPSTNFILTIHNVYPHDSNLDRKLQYKKRFVEISNMFTGFIVHTKTSKIDVIREFNLKDSDVSICCHGVFAPVGIKLNNKRRKEGKLHILQFGLQSPYKGTDILVKAVNELDEDSQKCIDVRIVGGISSAFYDELKVLDKKNIVFWKPYLLEEKELHDEINNSDIILLPYRSISQSGVLLLSIFFEKLIICSNLPSFMETMYGDEDASLDDDLFFESENVESLKRLLLRYIAHDVDEDMLVSRIRRLKQLYSWNNAAKSTWEVYKSLINNNKI